MSDMLRELYQEVIIDHNRKPRNFHSMDNHNHFAEGVNPLCGDELTVYLLVNNDIVEDISFQGNGCAISTASASIMTSMLKGKTVEQAHALFQQFHQLVTGSTQIDENMGKLAVLAGVKDYPARVKCATLAWHTLEAALNDNTAPVSTE